MNEISLIVHQAKDLGWKGPIVGSGSWGSAETIKLCGKDCYGDFFSTHYAAAGAKSATKAFIDRYTKTYGYTPNDVAALIWDAMNLAQTAIQSAGKITGNIGSSRSLI